MDVIAAQEVRVVKPWGHELRWAISDKHLGKGAAHQPRRGAIAPSDDCDVLDVSTPDLDDVVRLEDRYGRC